MTDRDEVDRLVEGITVDCYSPSEQMTASYEVFAEEAPLPTTATVDRLLGIWVADWRRLYDFSETGRDDLAVPEATFNRAMRIDTRSVDPLARLPRIARGDGPPGLRRNLAFRNLTRAKMLDLATGQQMARLPPTAA